MNENARPEKGDLQVTKVLLQAAELISAPERFVADLTARGIYPATKNKVAEVVPTARLATVPFAERWSASGAIWRQLLTEPREAVFRAWKLFRDQHAADRSVYSWCAGHTHEQHVAALRSTAEAA